MTSPWYNPNPLEPNTRATAEQVNAELAKIAAAFAQLPAPSAIGTGAGTPNYTHYAYADSADGTSNFTTGAAGNRSYIGVSTNRSSPTPSAFPEDYSWSRLKGADGTDGTDGTDGDNGQDGLDGGFRDFRFTRSLAQPAAATGDNPAGSFDYIPSGTEPVWVTSVFRNGDGIRTTAWEPWVRLSPLPSAQQYNPAVTYYEGMQVLFNGGTYILIVPSALGIEPTGTAQANATWDVVAAPGQPGEPATPPSSFSATIDLTTATSGINLRTIADTAGYTGLSDATVTFRVPDGVTISGNGTGGIAIDSGTWPTSSYSIALTLVVQSGGIVQGGGGRGGDGGASAAGLAGGTGGDSIFLRAPFSGGITVDSGAIVRAGGGGGGGGEATYRFLADESYGGAGGGGGGGAPNGIGGLGAETLFAGLSASNGSNGTAGGGGAGGSGQPENGGAGRAGGAGGAFAASGSAGVGTTGGAGGAAGYAIRKNGNAATVTNNGTITGTIL